MEYDIKDIKLAPQGKLRIEWAENFMPVLRLIRGRFKKERPLKRLRLACCLHVTTETANLMITLKEGGAEPYLCASNPLSTQDDVAASLVKDHRIPVFAIRGESNKVYYSHINSCLDAGPGLTMDDGADLVTQLHTKRRAQAEQVIGGSEETTTGVLRLRSMEKRGVLLFPMLAVNDSRTKHFFDNRYGTGQSTLDGIMRATNFLFAGSTVVVVGYGWCGRGFANKARGLGAQVIVTEVDPLKALEAVMDGFRVMPAAKAAAIGDLFVTLTGDVNVIDKRHFKLMKDGAIVANSGHFNVEVDTAALAQMAVKSRTTRNNVQEFTLANKRRIYLLAEGRLINLAAAEGHPASVMDMSFANQALGAEYLLKHGHRLGHKVYPVPQEIDDSIAQLKLKAMGVQIDRLTPEQKEYLASWEAGT